jgi:hypothetical protein
MAHIFTIISQRVAPLLADQIHTIPRKMHSLAPTYLQQHTKQLLPAACTCLLTAVRQLHHTAAAAAGTTEEPLGAPQHQP